MNTNEFDYTFSFGPIQNQNTQVLMFNHLEEKNEYFSISINDKDLSINGLSTVPSVSSDLIDLAIAIHAVDRLIKRRKDTSLSFRIELPIRNFDAFIKNNVCEILTRILEWYTNDCWYFEFSKRNVSGRNVEVQSQLPWRSLPSNNIEAALWSGGLDSLAGLNTRLLTNPDSYHILIGTGSNAYIHTKQRRIANEINQLFLNRTTLIQIPYRWSNTPSSEKSFGQRSRGFVFMLIGAACAYHIGCSSLYIYENGVGAINLPYSKAEVGLDHAKSVHPLSLPKVSELVSTILETPFQFTNPYWLKTKAQMVESLIDTNATNLILLSSSCDRARRLEKGITQCGSCPSCLLRRQSLIALNFDDSTIYENNGRIRKDNSHLRAMQHQVNKIRKLLKHSDPWMSLSEEYHEIDDIVDQISNQNKEKANFLRRQIIQLYSNYVDEWNVFEEYIEQKTLSTTDTYILS